MNFNERLSALRKKNKHSRDDLASKLGVSYSTIAKYESGSRQPDFKTLEKISWIYDVTIDYLLGRSDDPDKKKEDNKVVVKDSELVDFLNENKVTYKGRTLSEEEKEKVNEILKVLLKKDTD